MKIIFTFFLINILTGCTHYNHDKTVSLEKNKFELQKISGIYSNSTEKSKILLSDFIFPELPQSLKIDNIKVLVKENRITCEGYKNNQKVYTKKYIEGKDFNFNGNEISLKTNLSCFNCDGVGAMHLGIALKNYTLYLTQKGDAILRSNETGIAALILLPVPFAVIEENDLLYKRIKDSNRG